MCMNAFARVGFCTLLCCAWACGGADSTGPGNQQASVELTANFRYTHPRITTPGKIWFAVAANKPVARIELYNASTKVAEITPAADTAFIGASVTAADNGTQTYVVKAYDAGGAVAQSRVFSVIVDIRWTFIQSLGVSIESNDHGPFIVTDATNSIYYGGTIRTDSWNMFLTKYDADGHEQWTRTFGGPDSEFLGSLAISGSGRVYMAGGLWGRTQTGFSEARQCFVNVYDAGGSLLYTRQIKPASMDRTSGCIAAVDASNNLYILGSGYDASHGWLFAAKYDSEGNLLWNREISVTPAPGSQVSNIEPTGLAIDALGSGIYIGGHTGGTFDGAPNRGPQDLFVLKLDGDGNRLWGSQHGTAGLLTLTNQLTADPNGGVYVAGSTQDPKEPYTNDNAFIASYAADGTRRWVKTIDGGWGDRGTQVTVNSRGVYLLGWTWGAGRPGLDISEFSQGALMPGPSPFIEGSMDIFVARFTVAGDLQAVRLLGTPGGEMSSGIVTAANGDIYVAGLGATPLLARLQDAP
jgi:hypothetical protein